MQLQVGRFGLVGVVLSLLMACGQPPAPSSGEFEVSDEAGNSVTVQAVPTNGLKGDYFDNIDFTGTACAGQGRSCPRSAKPTPSV
jgi:hypothetical protein